MPRFGLVLVGAVLTLVVSAVPAAAHNVLTGTTPTSGGQVGATPRSVVLTFDQPAVAMGTQVLVTGPSGQVQTGPPRLVDNTVTQDLQGGAPAGTYTVAWRVISADGHPVSNTFTFTSTQPGTGTTPAAVQLGTPVSTDRISQHRPARHAGRDRRRRPGCDRRRRCRPPSATELGGARP